MRHTIVDFTVEKKKGANTVGTAETSPSRSPSTFPIGHMQWRTRWELSRAQKLTRIHGRAENEPGELAAIWGEGGGSILHSSVLSVGRNE